MLLTIFKLFENPVFETFQHMRATTISSGNCKLFIKYSCVKSKYVDVVIPLHSLFNLIMLAKLQSVTSALIFDNLKPLSFEKYKKLTTEFHILVAFCFSRIISAIGTNILSFARTKLIVQLREFWTILIPTIDNCSVGKVDIYLTICRWWRYLSEILTRSVKQEITFPTNRVLPTDDTTI